MLAHLMLLQGDPLRVAAGRFLDRMEIPYTQADLLDAEKRPYRGSIEYKMKSGTIRLGAKSGRVFGYYRQGPPAVGRYSASKFKNDTEARAFAKRMAVLAGMPGSWQLAQFSHQDGTLVDSKNAVIRAVFRPEGEGPFPPREGNKADIGIDATTGIVTDFDFQDNIKMAPGGWALTELDALDQMLHVGDRFDQLADGIPEPPRKLYVEWIDGDVDLYDAPIIAHPVWRIWWQAPNGRRDSFDIEAAVGGITRKFQFGIPVKSIISKDERKAMTDDQLLDAAVRFLSEEGFNADGSKAWRSIRAKSTLGFVTPHGIVEMGRYSGELRRFLTYRKLKPSDRPVKFSAGLAEKADKIAQRFKVPTWAKRERQASDSNQTMPLYIAEWAPNQENAFGLRRSFQVKLDGRDGRILEIRNFQHLLRPAEPAKLTASEARSKFEEAFRKDHPKVDFNDGPAAKYFNKKMSEEFADFHETFAVPREQIIRLGLDRPLQTRRFWRAGKFLLDDLTGKISEFDAWGDLP